MKTKYLKAKAGKNAYRIVQDRGFNPDLVKVFSGAAGGPKWLILYQLDRYLIQEFFNYSKTMHFIGGSIGAWRATAHASLHPLKAIESLYKNYVGQRYSTTPTKKDVSYEITNIVTSLLKAGDINSILNPGKRHVHIITSKAKFLAAHLSESGLKRKFLKVAIANFLKRTGLNKYASRVVFSNAARPIFQEDGIETQHVHINQENLLNAMRASGAIPTKMDPVVFNGSEYWDGGLVDYHLDLKYHVNDDIVLYPHFLPCIKPGWFDKYTRIRNSKHHHNTLLLYPSKAFIDMLPHQRLTTINDFYDYEGNNEGRIDMWKKVGEYGKYLVEDFHALRNTDNLIENLELF